MSAMLIDLVEGPARPAGRRVESREVLVQICIILKHPYYTGRLRFILQRGRRALWSSLYRRPALQWNSIALTVFQTLAFQILWLEKVGEGHDVQH